MYTKDIGSTFDKNIKNEWLCTNGIGGYSNSTIIGANTRKYHGLLIASIGNNLKRYLVLSKINEHILYKNERYSISSNECDNYIEKGYVYQECFEKNYFPEFLYKVQDVEIVKQIVMVYGENKVCIKYIIVNNNNYDIKFLMQPLVNYRNIHTVQNAGNYNKEFSNSILKIDVSSDNKLYLKATDSTFSPFENTFYNNIFYREERDRGFDAFESLYMPGEFSVDVFAKSKKEIILVAELNKECTIDDKLTSNYFKAEEIRLEKICKIASAKTEVEKQLAIAADQFIVTKNDVKTIIAGYPWFQDWGRDTFISLEGLTLKTNRYTDAKNILLYFANYIQKGLVPNYIDEKGGGSYNTCDASLWYIEAIYRYYKYTNDLETIRELFPKILEIVYCYMVGTDFMIGMKEDGLISAGDSTTQLTWMDAKVLDYIPTPRYGKAVEINALWYNALNIIKFFNNILIEKYIGSLENKLSSKDRLIAIYEINEDDDSEKTRTNLFLADKAARYYDELKEVFDGTLLDKVKTSFKKFYNDEGLYDTIEPFNAQIRPNQLISLSLSFPILSGDKAKEVLELVKNELLTPKGLKTLNSSDKEYKPKYLGDSFARDSSYHQGTVWPWLLGEYAKAHKYLNKKDYVCTSVEEFLNDGIIGNIAEIYDADEPRCARGALAQGWSVSAILLILK